MNTWAPLTVAAAAIRRPRRTLQTWVNRGIVSGACRISDRAALVWLPDVFRADSQAERRTPRRAA